ncbi:MAG TPA: hypothetical protein VLF21_00365 [Candidatus Saccharimonadales bacterium]|nr:hypothetical protein [Candidatus Saccharimonadales bacterium]
MPKSKLSKPKLVLASLGGLIIAFGVGFAIWLQTPWAHDKAKTLAAQAKVLEKTNEYDALVKYQMATFLDPANASYENAIADLYLQRHRPDAAILALGHLPKGEGRQRIAEIQFRQGKYDEAVRTLIDDRSGPAIELTAKCLMEKGQGSAAVELLTRADTDEAALLMALAQASLSQPVTKRSVSSPEAAQALQRAEAGKLPLAQELYTRGLLHSSQRVLESVPNDNVEKFKLLANINLSIQPVTSAGLKQAQSVAQAGLNLNPGDLPLRKLLRDVDIKLGLSQEASRQTNLINELSH